jgi:hypothetical protein
MPRKLLLATAVASLMLTATLARAGTIVNWSGDYVSSVEIGYRNGTSTGLTNVEWGDDASNDDSARRFDFSESIQLNPTIGGSYSGSSARFYGGLELWYVDGGASAPSTSRGGRVRNNSATDYHLVYLDNGANRRAYALWTWMKPDFLDASLTGATVAVTFDTTSSLSLDVTLNNANHYWYRFVVKSGDQYYLSSFTQTNDATLTGTALMSTTWALYSPALNLQANPGVTDNGVGGASRLLTYSYTTSVLTNIQAVGLYAESTGTGGGDRNFQWASFSVSAVVIPEPSTLALVGFGLLATVALRRVRKG